jgi:hypothetical protein
MKILALRVSKETVGWGLRMGMLLWRHGSKRQSLCYPPVVTHVVKQVVRKEKNN